MEPNGSCVYVGVSFVWVFLCFLILLKKEIPIDVSFLDSVIFNIW